MIGVIDSLFLLQDHDDDYECGFYVSGHGKKKEANKLRHLGFFFLLPDSLKGSPLCPAPFCRAFGPQASADCFSIPAKTGVRTIYAGLPQAHLEGT